MTDTSQPSSVSLPTTDEGRPPDRKPLSMGRRLWAMVDPDTVLVLGVLIAICVGLSFASPYFLTGENLKSVLEQEAVLAIVALGVTVVVISGNFDLSVGSGVALSSVLAAEVMASTHSAWLGIAVGLATGLAIGVVNGFVVTRLIVPSFIATLAMLVIARGLALFITDGQSVVGLPAGFAAAVTRSYVGIPGPIWAAIVMTALIYGLMRHTRLGVEIYAVGGNVEAARLSGLPVRRIRTYAFIISGVCIGVASLILLGRLNVAQATSGELLELYAVAAVVLGRSSLYGGQGSVVRTVLGVIIIGLIQNGLTLLNIDTNLQNVIVGLIFIAAASSVLIRRPGQRHA